jgi:hypothetical protein
MIGVAYFEERPQRHGENHPEEVVLIDGDDYDWQSCFASFDVVYGQFVGEFCYVYSQEACDNGEE